VASLDGRGTRYPAVRARLVDRLAALDEDGLTLELGDGKPPVPAEGTGPPPPSVFAS